MYWLTPINFGSSVGDKNNVSTSIQNQLLNQFTEWEDLQQKTKGLTSP